MNTFHKYAYRGNPEQFPLLESLLVIVQVEFVKKKKKLKKTHFLHHNFNRGVTIYIH